MDRYPLTAHWWTCLGAWVGRDGARKVARLARVAPEELDGVVAARVAPIVQDRARLITAMIRAGFKPNKPGDYFRPDGSEHTYGLGQPRKAERRALASWALPSGRD
ncbi:MAG TPA: hypothetical protein VFS67_33740 [Polyangiaceae bacterium]|nr:hypothetical protein [Polyangiaceae bacterium]